jgi:predicted ribosome quality control (RQC) complex YloA/Tae2 family protein
VYQVGERELALRLYGRGSLDFVVSPNFMCVTRYRRPTPRNPSSFAMQLRKHLGRMSIREVTQHGFDRVVEFRFDGYVLIFELFSRGNVILCDTGMRIIGLLDWQRWRHRILGVGRVYEYPPSVINPFEVDGGGFKKLMSESKMGIASTLATKFSLGGYYAEQVCSAAVFDPTAKYSEVDGDVLWTAISDNIGRIDGEVDARLLEDNVVPFGVEGGKHYNSFNDAVDEYFSSMEASVLKTEVESKLESKRSKLEDILRKQEEAFESIQADVAGEKLKGDLLYQRVGELNEVVSLIRAARKEGLSDGDIMERLGKYGFIRGLKGVTLTLEL